MHTNELIFYLVFLHMKKKTTNDNPNTEITNLTTDLGQDTTFDQWEYMNLPPDQLIPYQFNNKIHPDDQINAIINSITECWFRSPILIDEHNIILAGHGRWIASKKMWLAQVPVLKFTDLTDTQKKKYRILDNKLAELADRDIENLKIELAELNDPELNDLFDDLDLWLDNLLDVDEEQENQAPEISERPRVQQWDVFQLWDHRLVVWDATNLETVQLLMEDQKANLIITDPPYNVNYEGSTGMKIQNDDMSKESFYQFLYDVFTNMYTVQADGASIYVFHADTEWENFRKAFTSAGFKLAQCLIWVKNALVMGRQDYHWKHEPILYGRKPTAWHNWYSDRSQTTVRNFDKPLKNDLHPTMKPIDIITYPITNSSKKWDRVLDLFGWSWSTLIACEKTNRICYTMELDEKYAQVIVERYYAYTKGAIPIQCLNREIDLKPLLTLKEE